MGCLPTDTVGVEPACLSKREQQVLEMVADGHATKKIGDLLHLSRKTVEKFRDGILHKFKAQTMVVAVRRAIRQGLIAP